MSQSFNLYQLQKIDSRIDQINQRMSSIEHSIKNESRIESERKNVYLSETRREKLFQEISDLDEEINKKKIKVNQSEASLYGGKVQNPKELQSLQAEIASINKNITEKEATQADLIQDFELAEKEVESANMLLKTAIDEKEKEKVELMQENQNLGKEKEKLDSERLVAITQVKIDYLKIYEDIRKKRKNLAVSIVEDDTCTACGVNLTPSEWQAARSTDQLNFCPSCSRILYAG